MSKKELYYGDNLDVLKLHIKDESVDLIYLDPPFKSNADYNILFTEQDGTKSSAQMKVFEDTWKWDESSARTYSEIVTNGGILSKPMQALFELLGRNDMMAYLVMMAPRLLELHRVLKTTGSLYLHCDATASHYLKVLLDKIFGVKNFRREVIWRSGWVSGFKAAAKNWVRNHDVLLYYVKNSSAGFTFNKAIIPHPEGYKRRGSTKKTTEGVPLDDVWTDIYSPQIMSFSKEKLGYPTQKPEELLKRIIEASSNEGDVVLDPFCGCGTAIVMANKLNRQWIGIDITHLAITLVKNRLMLSNLKVIGEPTTVTEAQELARTDPYQFQWWSLGLVGARPERDNQKKGPDNGIDGRLFFHDEADPTKIKTIIISVKAGNLKTGYLDSLITAVSRECAHMGVLISFNAATRGMKTNAIAEGNYHSPGWNKDYQKIQLITVEQLLNGEKIDMPSSMDVNVTYKGASSSQSTTPVNPAVKKGKKSQADTGNLPLIDQ